MLLLELGVLLFERLQLRDLAGGAGWRRRRASPTESTIACVLSPLGQHVGQQEGMDLERRSDRLHSNALLLTQAHRRQLKRIAVVPHRSWP